MTTGLALGAIPRLGETLAPPTAEGPQTDGADLAVPRIMASGAEYLAVRAADIQGQESLPNPSDDLRGLVAVIAIYLIKGSSNWPRARAKFISNVLRARTDFARLFQLLPEEEQEILQADPALDLVVGAATRGKLGGNADPIRPDHNVIKMGTQAKDIKDLKIKNWLEGILQNKDLLTSAITDSDRGLGTMGEKVEGVGPDPQKEAGIFELRTTQGSKIPLDEWPTFALSAHRYITRLHGG